MKKQEYEHLIYYTICDVLYDNLKKTNYSTLNSLCKSIYTAIIHDVSIGTEEYKILALLLNEISKLYGLSDDESIIIVRKFFKEQMWLVYGEIVGVMKAHLKFFS